MTKFALNLKEIVGTMVRNGMKTHEAWSIVKTPGFRAKYLASVTTPKLKQGTSPFFDTWNGKRYLANMNPDIDTDELMKLRGLKKLTQALET